MIASHLSALHHKNGVGGNFLGGFNGFLLCFSRQQVAPAVLAALAFPLFRMTLTGKAVSV